jgi:hypothetical protein
LRINGADEINRSGSPAVETTAVMKYRSGRFLPCGLAPALMAVLDEGTEIYSDWERGDFVRG